jgi:hypothetical protein
VDALATALAVYLLIVEGNEELRMWRGRTAILRGDSWWIGEIPEMGGMPTRWMVWRSEGKPRETQKAHKSAWTKGFKRDVFLQFFMGFFLPALDMFCCQCRWFSTSFLFLLAF